MRSNYVNIRDWTLVENTTTLDPEADPSLSSMMEFVGMNGSADDFIRLGDTYGGLILWGVNPDGTFVLRYAALTKDGKGAYKTVSLDHLQKSRTREQNWCGRIVGRLNPEVAFHGLS
jgi:hypothetical protein